MKDWTTLFARFKGKWVALGDDEETVISSGTTARVARAKAQAKGHPNPILTRMPDSLGTYVGTL